MKEGLEGRERITKEEAFADLLTIEQKTLRECLVYLAWLDQEMARIQEIPRDREAEREEEEFKLTLEDAQLRTRSGRVQSARIAYEDALYNAKYSKHPKIMGMVAQIETAMKALPDNKGVTERPDDI